MEQKFKKKLWLSSVNSFANSDLNVQRTETDKLLPFIYLSFCCKKHITATWNEYYEWRHKHVNVRKQIVIDNDT
jgi:hypothetical protein